MNESTYRKYEGTERWERNSESKKERKIANKRFKEAHNPWARKTH